MQRDVGAPLISLNVLTGHRSESGRLPWLPLTTRTEPPPVSDVFPVDVHLHLLEIGIQAIQPSPYHAGLPNAPSRTSEPSRWFPGMLFSLLPFRARVSHQTQEPPFKSLPAEPGIRPSASWRTEPLQFSHDLHHRLRLSQFLGQTRILRTQPIRLLRRSGRLPRTMIRIPFRRQTPNDRIPGIGPFPDLRLI